MSELFISNARIKGTNPYSFRTGEWANIIGVKIFTPEGCVPRACFECVYDDGVVDYVAISDLKNYVIEEDTGRQDEHLMKAASKGCIRSGFMTEAVALSQMADTRNSILYTFGESTIEADMPKETGDDFPFERVTKGV